ncbi:MAG: CARDB domain-containing protein [Natrialbaceae archaeon]|nr:CARDB domain-containing protein [Natrialbaceae archaeon]
MNITEPVSVNETVNVTANVTNVGAAAGTQNITLAIENETVDTEIDLSLEPDENESINLSWTAEEAGTYEANVSSENDSDTREFEVLPLEPAFFDVAITDINETVPEGDTLEVTGKR